MSDTGKQSPLGINVLGALLQNTGFWINPKVSGLVGSSKTNAKYNPGDIINNTSLYWLTYAINDGYLRGPGYNPLLLQPQTLDDDTYNNLINIGQSHIPALGNSIPPTYLIEDPSGVWSQTGSATSGYGIEGDVGQGQTANWFPYNTGNPNKSVTQWGWLRLIALQAWNEFNYNGSQPSQDTPAYQYFVQSFLAAQGFVDNSNKAIYAIQDSKKFLEGVYSNMDDLTSSDITGVSLASRAFGQDLLNLGKAMDLSYISTFGLPSNLLKTLKKNNAVTQNLSYALLAAGLTSTELSSIYSGETVTLTQEQTIYGAFTVITEENLKEILTTLNCKTKGLTSLVDLLNIKKIFPISYPSLTVPVYNTVPSPTNSKTYYLLFINGQLNPQLVAPAVVEQIIPIVPSPPVEPPPPPPPPEPPAVTVEEVIAVTPVVTTGFGEGCPAPWINITLADRTTIKAGDIQPGMFVYTKHETKDVWGSYKVTAKEICQDTRWKVSFENGVEFVGTHNHRVRTDNDWCEIRNLLPGNKVMTEYGFITVTNSTHLDNGDVVKITVEDAHTYLTEGFLSHNIKKLDYGVGGGGCVALESYIPLIETEKKHNGRDITNAWMLESGMKISLGQDDNLAIVEGKVIKTLNDYQPCVRITTVDGISLVCSTTARIQTKEKGFIPATELYGKRVAVMRNGRTWYDEVIGLDDVGMKFVRVVDAGNNSFWAGETPDAFILHHNVPIDTEGFRYEKV